MATEAKTSEKTGKRRNTVAKGELGSNDTAESRRQRRLDALATIAGLWANRDDIPADGLEYQRQMRSE